jgi:hypothetical protein
MEEHLEHARRFQEELLKADTQEKATESIVS